MAHVAAECRQKIWSSSVILQERHSKRYKWCNYNDRLYEDLDCDNIDETNVWRGKQGIYVVEFTRRYAKLSGQVPDSGGGFDLDNDQPRPDGHDTNDAMHETILQFPWTSPQTRNPTFSDIRLPNPYTYSPPIALHSRCSLNLQRLVELCIVYSQLGGDPRIPDEWKQVVAH